MNKIRVNNLSKSFNNKLIFSNFNFEFETNKIYFIKGESGVGKTTLINIIGSIEKADSGSVFYDDINEVNQDFIAKNMSFYFQKSNINPNLTSLDNLRMVNDDMDFIDEVTKKLNINHLLNKKALSLSKGEKSRLSIAKIIIENKPVMLIDEPTANTDDITTQIIFDTLNTYKENKIVIIVTHDELKNVSFGFEEISFYKNLNYTHKVVSKNKSIEAVGRKTVKKNHFIAIKGGFSLIKDNWIRSILFIFALIFLFLSSTMMLTIFNVDQNEFIDMIKDSGLNYYELNEFIDENNYLSVKQVVSTNELTQSEVIFVSKTNEFDYKGSLLEVNPGEVIIPEYISDKYGVLVNDVLSIRGIDLRVSIIYPDNYQTYINILSQKIDASILMDALFSTIPIFMNIDDFNQTLENETIQPGIMFNQLILDLKQKTGLTLSLDQIRFNQASPTLNENEITLIISDNYQSNPNIYKMLNNTFELRGDNDALFSLKEMINELTVKNVMFSSLVQEGMVEVVLSKKMVDQITSGVFENNLLQNKKIMTSILDLENYDLLNIKNSFRLFENDVFELKVLLRKNVIYLWITYLILYLILMSLMILYSSGTLKSFQDMNCLYYLMGYKQIFRTLIFSIPIYLSYLVATIIYLVLTITLPIEKLIDEMFGMENPTFKLQTGSLNIIFILSILFILFIMGLAFVRLKREKVSYIMKLNK